MDALGPQPRIHEVEPDQVDASREALAKLAEVKAKIASLNEGVRVAIAIAVGNHKAASEELIDRLEEQDAA